MVTTTNLAQYLKGLNFPCDKQDCINHARQRNAPDSVLQLLERMPERRFNSLADVWSAVGEAY